jgi:hypothetical protein
MVASAFNRAARYHFVVEHERLPAVFLRSPCEVHMPRRYRPAQLAAAVIIGRCCRHHPDFVSRRFAVNGQLAAAAFLSIHILG